MDNLTLLKKKILVTGGNGFLGKNLIKKLISEKAVVYSLDLNESSEVEDVKYYQANLKDKEEIKRIINEIKPAIIFHLAAILDRTRDFSEAENIYEVNLFGTINLLQALKDMDYEKFIFTSTSEVYGGNNISAPFKETCDFVPASPYSLSKYAAEMAIRSFSNLYNKKFIIFRVFNFYGEGMPESFFLPQLINKLKKGEDFDMTKGEQKRDIIHIDAVLEALILSSKIEVNNEVINICSGKGLTIKEIAITLKQKLNSNSKINIGAIPYRDNEIWEMVGDNLKLQTILGLTNATLLKGILNHKL